MITIENLDFQYGQTDFDLRIDQLSIERGSKVSFVGPSGLGKTTLLNLISGILVPRQGSIKIGKVDITQLNDAARRDFRITSIGFVFQDFELIDYLNLYENILLPWLINSSLKLTDSIRRQARTLATNMGLGNKLNRPIGRLSQGEKQRVAVCRALLPGPDVLLADEPTGNLDPANKQLILDILFEHVSKTNATLIMVTHDHSLLKGFDKVIDFQDFQSNNKTKNV